MTWGEPPAGWDSNHAASLTVGDGTLDATGTYAPGLASGKLVVDVNKTGDYQFTLNQIPTPEPATLGLLLAGGIALMIRRVRKSA